MRYGFYLPTRGALASRDAIAAMARLGEECGFHSAMIADHVVFPVASRSRYPYTVSGEHPSEGDALEQLSMVYGYVTQSGGHVRDGHAQRLAARGAHHLAHSYADVAAFMDR